MEDEKTIQVKLGQIFECEGVLYAIAVPESSTVICNLNNNRLFVEFIKLYDE